MPRRTRQAGTMIDRIGRAIAAADGTKFEDERGRYRRLAMAALVPLVNPTDAMIDGNGVLCVGVVVDLCRLI
jgi:hypothetical protein